MCMGMFHREAPFFTWIQKGPQREIREYGNVPYDLAGFDLDPSIRKVASPFNVFCAKF
jgi:hypothetical protein